MKKLLSMIFSAIPETRLKQIARCVIYNLNSHPFKISYRRGMFIVSYPNFSIQFEKNPYHLLSDQNQYFKYFGINSNDVVIDAGGFWGTFSLFASKMVGLSGTVIVFEPDPHNYAQLMRHIKINNAKNIIVFNKGLWSKDANLEFSNSGSLGASFIEINKIDGKNSTIFAPVTSIDNCLAYLGIKEVDFIKMDIEGAEIEAIIGAKNILISNNVILSIASYHIVDGKPTYGRVEEILKDYGYKVKTESDLETITYANKE